MTGPPTGEVATFTDEAAALAAAHAAAAELKRRWRGGEPADAAAAVAENPALARYKSIVLDLAYEEYLLRGMAGAAPDHSAFVAPFPAFRASIRKMLDVYAAVDEHPEVLDPGAGEWPRVGAAFEGLDLHAELGKGAFGRAYLAYDPGTDRLCVLKVATGRSGEAKVIGRLAHPHVTDVYWARVVGPRTAVCMPFVGVSTLADVISAAFFHPGDPAPATADIILAAAEADGLTGQADRRSARVVRAGEAYLVGACAVAARIADAAAYLHSEGVVHGDLKPSNVVVGPGGAPHLIDFNLASGQSAPTAVRGTPAYMAPELLDVAVARTPGAVVDATRADVFSLGVVVVELLTGRLPFTPDGPTLYDIAAAVRKAAPALPDTLPPAVAAVLRACLSPDPAARPASAAELVTVLDRFVTDARTPPVVEPAPAAVVQRPRGRRRPMLVAVTALALLGGLSAVNQPPAPRDVPPPPLQTPTTGADFFARGLKLLRAGDVAGARIEFVTAYDRGFGPKALAFVAYCLAVERQPGPSAGFGKRATTDGAGSAEVSNNIGYALLQTNRPGEALQHLHDALKQRPPLQAALYNRAIARYQLGLAKVDGQVDIEAARDIAAALDAGPKSADLCAYAARIFAACCDRDPALRAAAIDQIKRAVAGGYDPAPLRRDPILKDRLGEAVLVAATDGPRGELPKKLPQLRLVEPQP